MNVSICIDLGIRGKVWKMAIGNELGVTYELFSQLQQMAKEKLEETRQVIGISLSKTLLFDFSRRKMFEVTIQHLLNYQRRCHIQRKRRVPILN